VGEAENMLGFGRKGIALNPTYKKWLGEEWEGLTMVYKMLGFGRTGIALNPTYK
jgi:hypothetical protein